MDDVFHLLDEMSARYEMMAAVVDERIRHLDELEREMNEFGLGFHMGDEYDDDDELDTSDHHVHFNDDVVVIGDHEEVEVYDDDDDDDTSSQSSSVTIRYYTHWSHMFQPHDSDSDTETIVDEWDDPHRTPTYTSFLEDEANYLE